MSVKFEDFLELKGEQPVDVLEVLDWDVDVGLRVLETPDLFALKRQLHSVPYPYYHHTGIPQLSKLNKLIGLRGIVVRTGPVRMREELRVFKCSACGAKISVTADELQFGAIPKPSSCTGRMEDGSLCRSGKFGIHTLGKEDCRDWQEVRVQELKSFGPVPRSISIVLCGDKLVDSVKAGDIVTVTGVLAVRWRPTKVNLRVHNELFIVASSMETGNYSVDLADDEPEMSKWWHQCPGLGTRDRIVNSFCPEIHGMFPVKLAVLLTLIGGSPSDQDCEKRSQGHLLLVGDPGTAKSHFLQAAVKLSRRAVMTSGSGSTNAGLTVAAVKEDRNWALEAGALVLADGGLCCIDEFGGLKEQDRAAIHEAMEQQTISIAKAGMVCRLSTRCSIIAACNSKDKYDGDVPISANVAIASPLLSRFDLIFVLLDQLDPEADLRKAEHILSGACAKGLPMNLNHLKEYVNHARGVCPEMTDTAHAILTKYYQKQRQQDLRDSARTTIRLLESLVRLAQAHAKLCLKREVGGVDAAVAVRLMDLSLAVRGLLVRRGSGELFGAGLFADEDPDKGVGEYFEELLPLLGISASVLQDSGGASTTHKHHPSQY